MSSLLNEDEAFICNFLYEVGLPASDIPNIVSICTAQGITSELLRDHATGEELTLLGVPLGVRMRIRLWRENREKVDVVDGQQFESVCPCSADKDVTGKAEDPSDDRCPFPTIYTLPEFDDLVVRALSTNNPIETRDNYAVQHSIQCSIFADCFQKKYVTFKRRYLPKGALSTIFKKLFHVHPCLLDDDKENEQSLKRHFKDKMINWRRSMEKKYGVGAAPPVCGLQGGVGAAPPVCGLQGGVGAAAPPASGLQGGVGAAPPVCGLQGGVGAAPPASGLQGGVGAAPPVCGLQGGVGAAPPGSILLQKGGGGGGHSAQTSRVHRGRGGGARGRSKGSSAQNSGSKGDRVASSGLEIYQMPLQEGDFVAVKLLLSYSRKRNTTAADYRLYIGKVFKDGDVEAGYVQVKYLKEELDIHTTTYTWPDCEDMDVVELTSLIELPQPVAERRGRKNFLRFQIADLHKAITHLNHNNLIDISIC